MPRLSAMVILIVLPVGAAAAGPVPNVKETINRGLTFLAKDNLAWKVIRSSLRTAARLPSLVNMTGTWMSTSFPSPAANRGG